jgi:hypothetical protein
LVIDIIAHLIDLPQTGGAIQFAFTRKPENVQHYAAIRIANKLVRRVL